MQDKEATLNLSSNKFSSRHSRQFSCSPAANWSAKTPRHHKSRTISHNTPTNQFSFNLQNSLLHILQKQNTGKFISPNPRSHSTEPPTDESSQERINVSTQCDELISRDFENTGKCILNRVKLQLLKENNNNIPNQIKLKDKKLPTMKFKIPERFTENSRSKEKKPKYIRPKISVEIRHLEALVDAKILRGEQAFMDDKLPPIKLPEEKPIQEHAPKHQRALTTRENTNDPKIVSSTTQYHHDGIRKLQSRCKNYAKKPARFLPIEEIENQIGINKDFSFKPHQNISLDMKLLRETDEIITQKKLEMDKIARIYEAGLKKNSILKNSKNFGETWNWSSPEESPYTNKIVSFDTSIAS
ncbi:unnamed protein product [Blepharisma stoltei]|uniref:Uncharacterized protein n=1 Tax=Blepharisma stoltei TaxID=1481888 RepID=A0AAU9IKW1_9CILI|nr:unnamed protein product [Blepharisma stoltei]